MENSDENVFHGPGDRLHLKDVITLRSAVLPVSILVRASLRDAAYPVSFPLDSTVIGLHVIIVIALVEEGTPSTFRAVLIVATVALHNLMACKVYRLLKSDLIDGVPEG